MFSKHGLESIYLFNVFLLGWVQLLIVIISVKCLHVGLGSDGHLILIIAVQRLVDLALLLHEHGLVGVVVKLYGIFQDKFSDRLWVPIVANRWYTFPRLLKSLGIQVKLLVIIFIENAGSF